MQDYKKIQRLKRAIDEKSMKVINYNYIDDNVLIYKVLGNRGVYYEVEIPKNDDISCECIDQKKTKSFCKHIYLIYVKVFNILPSTDLSTFITEDYFDNLVISHNNFLNKKNTNKKEIKLRNEDDDECSICFDNYSKQETYGCKKCRNGFHMKCIKEMMTFSKLCPMCRCDIDFSNEEYEDEEVIKLEKKIKKM